MGLTFTERCQAEITRDVVFLFQRSDWILTGIPWTDDGEYRWHDDGVLLGDDVMVNDRLTWCPRDDAEYLTWAQLEEMNSDEGGACATQRWRTEFVTATREEGEAHGRDRAYNYPDGWRVYGIPSTGLLAKAIQNI